VPTKELENYERLCRYASEMEIGAAEAERASIRLKQVEYWADKIGSVWEGSISGVAAWGIFVEDKATGTEGMIHVNDLDGDYYVYEESQYRMVGKNTKKIFRLGDKITAKVRSADLKRRLLGLSYVPPEKPEQKPKK
jgi:ribonuclease R